MVQAEIQGANELRPEKTASGPESRKRRLILDAARKLFFAHGYDMTSMDDVVREAGVSKATLYAYFQSKEALFAEVAREERARVAANLFVFDPEDHDVPAMLGRVGRGLVRVVTNPRMVSWFRAVLAVGDRMPQLGADYYNDGVRGAMRRLAIYLEHQARLGILEIDDPDLAAAQFLEMAQTTMARPMLFGAATMPSDERINYVVDSAVRVFMAAYGRRVTGS